MKVLVCPISHDERTKVDNEQKCTGFVAAKGDFKGETEETENAKKEALSGADSTLVVVKQELDQVNSDSQDGVKEMLRL
jgi:hypothetical protein